MSEQPERGEAICFTAGPQGSAFGAGVIHAWLASDRAEPRVVAGISTGAVTAAAMQRSLMERGLPGERTEASRWGWFERYLTDILDRPLDVIWKALPDPVDYLAATTPVRDLSCPVVLQEEEILSRYHFWILTKLGTWIAGLPITIGELGTWAVLKVRHAERVPLPMIGPGWITSLWRQAWYVLQSASIGWQLLLTLIFTPLFTRTCDRFVADDHEAAGRPASAAFPGVRPLFGWPIWLLACLLGVVVAAALVGIAAALFGLISLLLSGQWRLALLDTFLAAFAFVCVVVIGVRAARPQPIQKKLEELADRVNPEGTLAACTKKTLFEKLSGAAMKGCCINLHLIHNYQMKRRLWNRFATPLDPEPKVQSGEKTRANLVIVASALQPLVGLNHQCWAHPGVSLIDALAAACASQPLYAPTHVRGSDLQYWLRENELTAFRNATGEFDKELDLVDGAVIRKNPLPALFNWLQDHRDVAKMLESESQKDARIHVIYNVPIEPFDAYEGKAKPDRIDLIEAAEVGILMRTRRDTRVEVDQTNYLSRVLNAEKSVGVADQSLLAIFADELAPARELKFENSLSPTRPEGLIVAAEGCRRTLGRLYAVEIQNARPASGSMACAELLQQIAPERRHANFQCGLPEICANCTGTLIPYPTAPRNAAIVNKDFGCGPGYDLRKELPHLCANQKPRIVFVASGGVFRGAFHIGLLGAMQALDMTPDLVVGASVGTLMGGALAAMRYFDDPLQQRDLLAELTRTFMRVDRTVALTVPVKTAVKQLGLRARNLKLSPAGLRAAVQAGTASDVGYASTGVPPIITDMLSQLFIIPPSETVKAGSDFLAGRFAKAASCLISLIRTNTLESLGIRYAVIGTSLLEGVAHNLMGAMVQGVDLAQRQPYMRKNWKLGQKSTAVFCTTAYVNQRWPLVLGRDALTEAAPDFRFLYAALSSSAFPAAFPARQEAEVFPGTGLATNLFCDGGMFDNLPFVPAIEVLSETQKLRFQDSGQSAKEFLKTRLNAPDLMIAGGFDPLPSDEAGQCFTSRSDIGARTDALGASVKTDSFIDMGHQVAKRLQELVRAAPDDPRQCSREVVDIMTGAVVAGVVNIVPATELHVNPTFGFSRSLGFDPERVSASIADGCFQTLRGLQQHRWREDCEVHKSLVALEIHVKSRTGAKGPCACPHFQVECAFAKAAEEASHGTGDLAKAKAEDCSQVYRACCSDPVHAKLAQIGGGTSAGLPDRHSSLPMTGQLRAV